MTALTPQAQASLDLSARSGAPESLRKGLRGIAWVLASLGSTGDSELIAEARSDFEQALKGDDPGLAEALRGVAQQLGSLSPAPAAHTHVAADITDFATAVLLLASALGHTHVAAEITDFNEAAQDALGTAWIDSGSINFTYDDAANTLTGVVIPGGVDHDALANFAAAEHVDHTAVSIIAGTGMSGGGDISASRTLNCTITQYTDADVLALLTDANIPNNLTLDNITQITTRSHASLQDLTADDHAQYLLASDATNRATFAANWLDLTDGGNTTLHTHSIYALASHTHSANDITSDTMATARLGSGTADATTFLRGDSTWQPVSGGDVVGPASATDRSIPFYDGTSGKLLGQVANAPKIDASGNQIFDPLGLESALEFGDGVGGTRAQFWADTGTADANFFAEQTTFRGGPPGTTGVVCRLAGQISPKNNIKITGTATGTSPTIEAEGLDADIDVNILTKGTGQLLVNGSPISGSGEANTASNVGVGGVGPFKQKAGVDLEFRNVNAASSKVSVALDAVNNEIDIDVVEANLTLSNLGGAVTDGQVPDTITLANITQITARSHTNLSDIGSNTHADIDTHIAAANPHSGSQPLDADLTAIAALASTGFPTRTAADTWAQRSLAAPAAGLTITNPAGVAGNPTFALANDLAAVEGLATTGIAKRTGADAWTAAELSGDVSTSGATLVTTLATKHKTRTGILYIENPTATDEFPLCHLADAASMVRVIAVTDTGTVDFNIEKRAQLTPDVAGTNIWSADKQATAAGLNQTSFDSGTVSADTWLHYSASAIASTPTKLWLTWEATIT